MENLSLHHIGIIVPTEERAAEMISILGLEESFRGYVPEYKSLCIFTKTNETSSVEFVIPDGGNLTDYNHGKGGIHHIALNVEDIKSIQAEMESKGIKLLEQTPVKGAGDFIVNFMRPRYTGGILVEYVQTIEPKVNV
jgi:methylmalonyl-CoA/ethylmalonyl-CoA epimerase